MHKRKIGGLVPYGDRTYNKSSQKLQAGGGFAVYSGQYNWREDPYELMLLQNKFKQDRANTYGDAISGTGKTSKRSSTGKLPKVGELSILKGGLDSSRAQANKIYRQEQDQFFAAVEANGLEWLETLQGQRAFQDIKNRGIELQAALDSQKERFDKYETELSDNEQTNGSTKAISNNGNMMVIDKSGNVAKVTVGKYLENIENIKGIMSINDVSDYVRYRGGLGSDAIMDEFLGSGVAVSENSVYDAFIKNKEDLVNYRVAKGKLMKADDPTGEYTMDIDQVRKAINNTAEGFDFDRGFADDSQFDANKNLADAVSDIYSKIFTSSGDQDKLLASLRAEILSDYAKVDAISKGGTVQERALIMDSMVKRALINKFIDKGVVKSSKDSGGEESNQHKYNTKGNIALAGTQNIFKNPQATYKMGEESENDKVTVFQAPMTTGITNLGIIADPEHEKAREASRIDKNEALTKNALTNRVFMESGAEVADLIGNAGDTKDFLQGSVALSTDEDAPLVMLPIDQDGKPVMHLYQQLNKHKMAARKEFIKWRKDQDDVVDYTAEDLYPNNLGKEQEYKEFQMFLESGKMVDEIQEKIDKGDNSAQTREILQGAIRARKVLSSMQKDIPKVFKGSKVTIKPFFKTKILFDNDDVDVKSLYEADAKDKNYGTHSIKKITSDIDRHHLQKVNDIDNFNFGVYNDHLYTTNVFLRAKDAFEYGGATEEETRRIADTQRMYDIMLKGLASQNIATADAGIADQVITFLAQ